MVHNGPVRTEKTRLVMERSTARSLPQMIGIPKNMKNEYISLFFEIAARKIQTVSQVDLTKTTQKTW